MQKESDIQKTITTHNATAEDKGLIGAAFNAAFIQRLNFTDESRAIHFETPPLDDKGRPKWSGLARYQEDELVLSNRLLKRVLEIPTQQLIDKLRNVYTHELAHFISPNWKHDAIFMAVNLALHFRAQESDELHRFSLINFYDMSDDINKPGAPALLAWAWDFAKRHWQEPIKAEELGQLAVAEYERFKFWHAATDHFTYEQAQSYALEVDRLNKQLNFWKQHAASCLQNAQERIDYADERTAEANGFIKSANALSKRVDSLMYLCFALSAALLYAI